MAEALLEKLVSDKHDLTKPSKGSLFLLQETTFEKLGFPVTVKTTPWLKLKTKSLNINTKTTSSIVNDKVEYFMHQALDVYYLLIRNLAKTKNICGFFEKLIWWENLDTT